MGERADDREGIGVSSSMEKVGPEELAIYGGSIPASQAGAFLDHWELPQVGFEYSVIECFDAIEIAASRPDELPESFDRGRFFGTHGDMTLRRDGERIDWYFVGSRSTDPSPTSVPREASYWHAHEDRRFERRVRRMLLWGERRDPGSAASPFWHENRVAKARLCYPNQVADRVVLTYDEYSDGGRVCFVWWKGLEGYGQRNDQAS